jgi:hypothetical protein
MKVKASFAVYQVFALQEHAGVLQTLPLMTAKTLYLQTCAPHSMANKDGFTTAHWMGLL